ncbi:peptidylprolyl isomerase [Bacterioplanes sanyensis]|uniref:Peptidyl-prolyl cis-trans isomerase n=1 Tax=Bacterioplanes sanyensis TaxID=1249553 RepID=A0A222FMB2_9GAMM|nr:FKBP-type peptidyl-prolyl cis-trans isomerase [Bacterioplanes sanyensis]ASP39363.1 peptidylprolyl isomerase [Bacterioplanes sanyensis]
MDAMNVVAAAVVAGLVWYGWSNAKKKGQSWQANRQQGEDYWQQQRQRDEVTEVGDGVLLEYLQRGQGSHSPTLNQTILVHYTGTLVDGTVFDCSRQRNEPLQLSLNQVIAGWQQGLTQLVEGDRVRLVVPQQLAYGRRQAGKILPYSTLIFDIELLKVG